MNYQHPERRRLLAAEYVLGTLHGRARQRFVKLLAQDPELQAEVSRWEKKLNPLAQLKPIEPPAHVWESIADKINGLSKPPATTNTRWWYIIFILVGALALTVAVVTFYPQSSAPFVPNYQAIVANKDSQAVWRIQADTTNQLLDIEALRVPAIMQDQDYELWLLPTGGGAPISLGLLPESGNIRSPLITTDTLATIAISLEPAGGSATGAPTGPIVFQSRFIETN